LQQPFAPVPYAWPHVTLLKRHSHPTVTNEHSLSASLFGGHTSQVSAGASLSIHCTKHTGGKCL
jgi:hypothetical protein